MRRNVAHDDAARTELGLDAAVAPAVARDGDRAAHVDPEVRQVLVVAAQAAPDVAHRARGPPAPRPPVAPWAAARRSGIGGDDVANLGMVFLNTTAFRMADMVGTEWADMGGATFDRVVDQDAIEGYIRKYWNLITVARNHNGVIEDLNDIASIDRIIV